MASGRKVEAPVLGNKNIYGPTSDGSVSHEKRAIYKLSLRELLSINLVFLCIPRETVQL